MAQPEALKLLRSLQAQPENKVRGRDTMQGTGDPRLDAPRSPRGLTC